jgi:Sulfatase
MKERAMTIDRSRLPIRRQAFGGVANRTLAGSQPDWNVLDAIAAPEGAPNILLVLIDDAGFGNPSTFGGPISTPTFSRVADDGLRYNACHVTALCSPTRVSLLTGRNHHAVGFGSIGELATGFPGYTGFLPRTARRSRGYCATTATARPRSENGTSRRTISKGPRDRSTAGRTPGGSTTSGASWAVRLVSTTRCWSRTTACSDRPRTPTSTSRTRWRKRRSSGCTPYAPKSRTSRG